MLGVCAHSRRPVCLLRRASFRSTTLTVERFAQARPRSRPTFVCPPLPPPVILTGPTPAATSPHRASASAADTHGFLHSRRSLLALRCMSVPPSGLQLSSVHASYASGAAPPIVCLAPFQSSHFCIAAMPICRALCLSHSPELTSRPPTDAPSPQNHWLPFLATSGACLHPRPPVTAPASASPRCVVPRRRSPRHYTRTLPPTAPLPSHARPPGSPSAPTASVHSAFILGLIPCRAIGTLPPCSRSALIKPTMRDPRLGLYSLSSRAHSYTLAVAPFYAGAARPKRVESNKHLGIYIHSFNLYGPVGAWIWLWLWLVLS
ncbi:hypothetical protein B0H13DRAFT_2670216 [Mycena leptocephala]|nr:hypothetical protein B0H13DRAFT_2670216 [Mycena leptocephala]